MRAPSALALVLIAGILLTSGCAGREEGSVRVEPARSPAPTLAAGEIVPWADIPAPLATSPQPAIPPLTATLTAPTNARPGDELRYEVTLRNNADTTYQWLANCPVFLAILQTSPPEPRNVAGTHQQLNCGRARDLPPGGEARFEMRFFLPQAVPPGPWILTWSFVAPGQPASPPATSSLTIER